MEMQPQSHPTTRYLNEVSTNRIERKKKKPFIIKPNNIEFADYTSTDDNTRQHSEDVSIDMRKIQELSKKPLDGDHTID